MFEIDELCKLAYLGLWETSEFYCAQQYVNFRILTKRSSGFIIFRHSGEYNGRPIDSLVRLSLGYIEW